MYKVCTAQEMRNIDRISIDSYQIPGIVLMENAALACVGEIKKDFPLADISVCVVCGKGNNGGDGLAIARHLHNDGAKVKVLLVSGSEYLGDAKINYDICESMDIDIDEISDIDDFVHTLSQCDVIIDAILGTGAKGEITGHLYDVINAVNESGKYVLSVDVPSGINSDTGEVLTVAVNGTKTVTFGAYKRGMFLYPAADFTGEIVVAPISIPQSVIDAQGININVTDNEFVKNIIKNRKNNSHKGDYGKLLIIAGSKGMSGAAYLASEAALRSGAGLITVACPECINSVLENKTTEVMTMPLDEVDGCISYNSITKILKKVTEVDAVLIGPGLGRGRDICEIVKEVLKRSTVPVIVDADALYAVSQNMDVLKECTCELIFTPHAMEMSRLTGVAAEEIENDRINISRDFSDETGAVLLLKGHHTIVTSPSLKQYINNTGNAGMASGGCGDVLAGIISALVAKGTECTYSAAAGAYIHGLAGDIAKEKYGVESMSARDIIDCLSDAFCRILQVDKTNILC